MKGIIETINLKDDSKYDIEDVSIRITDQNSKKSILGAFFMGRKVYIRSDVLKKSSLDSPMIPVTQPDGRIVDWLDRRHYHDEFRRLEEMYPKHGIDPRLNEERPDEIQLTERGSQ